MRCFVRKGHPGVAVVPAVRALRDSQAGADALLVDERRDSRSASDMVNGQALYGAAPRQSARAAGVRSGRSPTGGGLT
jgi:hypothetical protein